MDELLDMIDASFQRNSICLSPRQKEQFKIYCTFLLEYNKKVNLTALTQKQELSICILSIALPLCIYRN